MGFVRSIAIWMIFLPCGLAFGQDPGSKPGFFDAKTSERIGKSTGSPGTFVLNADSLQESSKPSRFSHPKHYLQAQVDSKNNAPSAGKNKTPTPVSPSTPSASSEKKKKLTFAEAQPEDITDENFPDLVESFNYPSVSIKDLTAAIGELTKKNFIIDEGLGGKKITIVAPSPVTVAQAWKLFLSALAMNDLTIVPTGNGYLKIRKSEKALNDSIETYSGAYYPNTDQLITRIIQLKYVQASSLKEGLKKSFGDNKKAIGSVEAYDDTNSIIISGYGSSVQRISTIIEGLDKPGFEDRLEVIPILHARSQDISDLIDKIIKGGDKKESGGGTRFRNSRNRFGKKDAKKVENLKLVTPDARTNSIIVVGNSLGIQRIRDLIKQLDYPLDLADAGGVYVYYVKYGVAAEIAKILSGVADVDTKKSSKGVEKKNNKGGFQVPKAKKPIFRGNVVIEPDENTNSLIITASKQDYKVVRNLLAKIDIPKDQVFVEAIIMEMDASHSDIWNINYLRFFKNENATGGTGGTGQGAARVGFTGGNFTELINPLGGKGAILNLGDPSETIQINAGGSVVEIPSLLALINFLKEKTNANVLSTPNILAMDNEESEIEVGEEVPVGGVQNFSQNLNTITPQFKDATIRLKITPYISRDSDAVRLVVDQEIKKVSTRPIQAEALAQSTQALTKKHLKTTISLESGQTAVLGGLMEDEDTVQETKIPLLGDIPILGWLFKNKTIRKVKKNLVIFLTPEIIRNSEGHRRLLRNKMGERIDWIKQNAGGRDPYGERFNNLIKESSASTSTGILSEEVELDIEEATPFDNDPEERSLEEEFKGNVIQ